MENKIDWKTHKAAVWRTHRRELKPVTRMDAVSLENLVGIERQKERVVENTERFLKALPANHVLLWGNRGTGKSSIVKALLNRYADEGLRVVEFPREALEWLPEVADDLRTQPYRFVIFCDDLSFEAGETGYKGLKSVMEGSIEAAPENILVYATSNRRHLVPEYMSDNLGATVGERGELHLSDSVEERISLADRFGLSISFYHGNLDDYLAIVAGYFKGYEGDWDALMEDARRFAQERAVRSGRTARQFYNHAVGKRP